jgi:hypothetical protein
MFKPRRITMAPAARLIYALNPPSRKKKEDTRRLRQTKTAVNPAIKLKVPKMGHLRLPSPLMPPKKQR